MKNRLITAILMMVGLTAFGQTPQQFSYNTPVGSNFTVNGTAQIACTNDGRLVSRTICWQGAGILWVIESNTLVSTTGSISELSGGTNFVYGPNNSLTNTQSGATNFIAYYGTPGITNSSGIYPVASNTCYQSSAPTGLFRGFVLLQTAFGNTGTAYIAEGKQQ
jgi:hypothetical protein